MDYSIYYESSNKTVVTLYDYKTITIVFEGQNHKEEVHNFIFTMLKNQGKIGY